MVIVEGGSFGGEFGASHCNQWGLCDALFSNYFEDLLAICRPSGCTETFGVVGVYNRSQMRTSKCTCLVFGVSIGLDPG